MVGELKACIPSIVVREELLVTTPDPLGLQHDEVWMTERWYFRRRWKRRPSLVEFEFRLHPTVVERLEAPDVPDPNCSRQNGKAPGRGRVCKYGKDLVGS